jgi:deoxyhypusine synthase
VRTIPVGTRHSKVRPADFAAPFDAKRDSFAAFVRGLPRILKGTDLRALVQDIRASRRKGKPVIVMIGAHVIKVGLAPVIIDLMERKTITAVAMNSAAAIHDVETALWGKTSEDVAASLADGRFGMARETGEFINGVLTEAFRSTDLGYGEALGKALARRRGRASSHSILLAAHRLGIPATVHAAIGTDIIHQQPTMDGAATGELSFRDFRLLCRLCMDLRGGGVVLNVGSAVILPEVFLKALTVARNLGAKARGFTTAVFDMNQHYRPTVNVQLRPTQDGGKGYYFTGHHELMIPLLAAMVKGRGR